YSRMTSNTPSPRYSPSSGRGIVASVVGEIRPSTLASSVAAMDARLSNLWVLDDRRDALPDSHAQRCDPVAAPPASQLPDQRRQDPGSGAAERVAEGDRAAVDVQPLLVDPELADAGEDLGGERLVDLDQVDLVEAQAGGVERPSNRGHRPHSHVRGVDTRDTDRDDAPQGAGSDLLRSLVRRQHQAGGAVVQGRGIAGGHRAALAKCRSQP